MMYFSWTLAGFIPAAWRNDGTYTELTWPSDAVEITDEYHSNLLAGELAGQIISADINGYPILIDSELPSAGQLSAAARQNREHLLRSIYDPGIMIALRVLRMASTQNETAYAEEKIAELDAYAVALQEIPEQSGFPDAITWPVAPTK